MSQVGYIILGWLLGVLSMLITRWLQEKEEKQKKEIAIISEVLTYLFKLRQTYNNLLTDRRVLEEGRKQFPDRASELEKNMYARFDDELSRDFFPNLMIHSFHLKRIEDNTFWQDFEALMGKCEELGKMILGVAEIGAISKLNEDVMDMMKSFTEKCLAKTKV